MNVPADLAGDQGVVPGKDLGGDPVAGERGNGRPCRFLGRIEESDVAEQDEVALVGDGKGPLVAWKLPVGDAKDAVAVSTQ